MKGRKIRPAPIAFLKKCANKETLTKINEKDIKKVA